MTWTSVAIGEADVSVRPSSGDVELRAATIRALQATTTSGDVQIAGRLAGPGPFSDRDRQRRYAQLAPAGDVTDRDGHAQSATSTRRSGGRSEGGRGRRSLTVGAGGPLVDFRSMSGDLHCRAARRRSGIPRRDRGRAPRRPSPSSCRAAASGAARRPSPPSAAVNGAIAAAYEDARLRILRSLERGEIDVAEAGHRLEALDGGSDALTADEAEPAGTAPDETTRPCRRDGTETARSTRTPTDA